MDMMAYFTEAEEIKMDVQVGPQEEIEAKSEDTDTCDRCGNPIDQAKKDPKNVPVACCVNKEGIKEFYIDASDVIKLADLNEMTILEALNEIIDVHEDSEMDADNMIIVMSEGTEMYERALEYNGAACIRVCDEAMDETQESDINIDVQVGPNGDEITVSEDPQISNPVDAVKRNYDSVVVAKHGDDFFMDVEDVQKCAELNCESVIDTLNNLIDINEEYGMDADNIRVVVNENTPYELCVELGESGVVMEANFSFLPKFRRDPELKKYVDTLEEARDYINIKGIDSRDTAIRICRIAARCVSIIVNIESVIAAPTVITIAGIPVYLVLRLIAWGVNTGEEVFAKEQGFKILNAYKDAMKKCDDEKVKAEMQKKCDKLESEIAKLGKK